MRYLLITIALFVFAPAAFSQDTWRVMSADELAAVVPEKAPVIKENIETELRTATGITDGKSRVFGVVIITAGYEADGKFTHFLRTDTKMTVGGLTLKKGDYVFGSKRVDNTTLKVSFYHARTGFSVGSFKAKLEQRKGAIYSFHLKPGSGKTGTAFIGRYTFAYSVE